MRMLTSGESHGKVLTAIIEGIPANLEIDEEFINLQLKRRQMGFGRGKRMEIECDRVEITSGVRYRKTIGSPVTLLITNKDMESYNRIFGSMELQEKIRSLKPRPGHGDLAGVVKYNQWDIRNILERSSARETAIRTAVGALAMIMLKKAGIQIVSTVTAIGNQSIAERPRDIADYLMSDNSPVRCFNHHSSNSMVMEIEKAIKGGYSLGGIFEVAAFGVPIGLGSHSHWDRKLDGRLAGALMSIQGIKGVEIGAGFEGVLNTGLTFHDDIYYNGDVGYHRLTNNAGGIEGGMSNGMPIIIRCGMKPIPTMTSPKQTIDMDTKNSHLAFVDRADVCAVPSASVVAEGVVAWELAQVFMDKFGGDSIEETMANYTSYIKYVGSR